MLLSVLLILLFCFVPIGLSHRPDYPHSSRGKPSKFRFANHERRMAVQNGQKSVPNRFKILSTGDQVFSHHCCPLARTDTCRTKCLDTKALSEFYDADCTSPLLEPELSMCLKEAIAPCKLGCSQYEMDFCAPYISPLRYYRTCSVLADSKAKRQYSEWRHFLKLHVTNSPSIPILDPDTCYPDAWKRLACYMQMSPCEEKALSSAYCWSDITFLASHCVDRSKIGIDSSLLINTISKIRDVAAENNTDCVKVREKRLAQNSRLSAVALKFQSFPCREKPCDVDRMCKPAPFTQRAFECVTKSHRGALKKAYNLCSCSENGTNYCTLVYRKYSNRKNKVKCTVKVSNATALSGRSLLVSLEDGDWMQEVGRLGDAESRLRDSFQHIVHTALCVLSVTKLEGHIYRVSLYSRPSDLPPDFAADQILDYSAFCDAELYRWWVLWKQEAAHFQADPTLASITCAQLNTPLPVLQVSYEYQALFSSAAKRSAAYGSISIVVCLFVMSAHSLYALFLLLLN